MSDLENPVCCLCIVECRKGTWQGCGEWPEPDGLEEEAHLLEAIQFGLFHALLTLLDPGETVQLSFLFCNVKPSTFLKSIHTHRSLRPKLEEYAGMLRWEKISERKEGGK